MQFDDDSENGRQLQEVGRLVNQGFICISDSEPDEDEVVIVEPQAISPNVSSEPQNASCRSASTALQFPNGVVRLTRMLNEPPAPDKTVTLADIIQKHALKKALLSTYVLDMDWLQPHFLPNTKLVVVTHYNPKEERSGIYQTEDGKVTMVHPRFGYKQMYPMFHSKIMILWYESHVRLVVSSANLVNVDWDILQNIVFIQDLPLMDEAKPDQGEFKKTLECALKDMSVPDPVIEQLDFVDFSKVQAHLVTSVPTAKGWRYLNSPSYGIVRLSEICRRLPKVNRLQFYSSSMGRLTPEYLEKFWNSAVGKCRLTEDMDFQVGFHTRQQGDMNKFGEISCASMKFPSAYYQNPQYPRYCLYKIQTRVPNTLAHAKVMLGTNPETGKGWMYLGSHNFTPGAWGNLRGEHDLFVNNYELGVVLPGIEIESTDDGDSVKWNGSWVPLPFRYRWEKYSDHDIPLMDC